MHPSGRVPLFEMEDRSKPLRGPQRPPTQAAVNPYRAPRQFTHLTSPSKPENPAKPLMLLIGCLYGGVAPTAFLYGLQAGLHPIVGSALILILACGTIFLALQEFTPLCRAATIVWGLFLVAAFAFATLFAYSFVLMLLIVIPIPILALRQNPHREALTDRDTGAANQADARADWKRPDDKREEIPPG